MLSNNNNNYNHTTTKRKKILKINFINATITSEVVLGI